MKRILSLLLFVLAASACISNDIPYPVIKASINSLEVEGAIQVNIDKEKRKVEIELDEAVDIRAVNILSATLEPENATPSRAIVGKHDLSQPEQVILSVMLWMTLPLSTSSAVSGSMDRSVRL